jgi:diguanylate cyclase (GGDEF)-like protein/PAS domain S-box-containing protein
LYKKVYKKSASSPREAAGGLINKRTPHDRKKEFGKRLPGPSRDVLYYLEKSHRREGRMIKRKRESKLSTLGTVLLAVLTGLFVSIGVLFVRFESDRYRRLELEDVRRELTFLRISLNNRIYANIHKVSSVKALVAMNPDLTQDDFARAMEVQFTGEPDLRNIGLANDMVLRFMYPIEGNEAAVGLDYTTLPDQVEAVELARRLNEIVLAGPLNLVQGGEGIIARIPIQVTDPATQIRGFWGFASVVMNSDSVFAGAGLTDDHDTVRIALRGRDARGAEGDVFWGDPSVFENNPVTQFIELPHGSWQIGAVPSAGWGAYSSLFDPLVWVYFVVASVILAFTVLIVFLLNRNDRVVKELEKERNLFAAGPVFNMEFDSEPYGDWPVTYVSSNVEPVLGYTPAEMLRPEFSYSKLIHPDDAEGIIDELKHSVAAGRDSVEQSYRVRTKTGQYLWVYDFTILVRNEDGSLNSIRSYMYDQSARKQAEQGLRIAEARLEKTAYELTENIPVGTYTMVQPAEGGMARFSFMSRRFLELTGLTREEAKADPLKAFACVHPDNFDEWVAMNARTFEEKVPFFGETRVVIDGEIRWVTAESKPRSLPDGTTVWEGVLSDITDRKKAEAVLHEINIALETEVRERRAVEEELKVKTVMLEKLSMQDGLTGIPNRRHFDDRAELERKRAVRTGLPLSLVMMDIDHFKSYNDHYGHGAGDDCLKQVARALMESCDRPLDLVARYGGEEFVALLPETDAEGTLHLAEKMRAAVEGLSIPHGYSSTATVVTVSVGFATHWSDSFRKDLQYLQQCADRALYQSKEQGRNRVCRFG